MQLQLSYLKSHPAFSLAQHIMQQLKHQGFMAYFAGGCVRDGLLGRTPKDLDIVTNATPDQVEGLFEKTVATGKAFGVIRVFSNTEPLQEIEVATFRTEGGYQDGRHPGHVNWSSEVEDAKRRDFTVNALFYDLVNDKVIDHVGGVLDLQNKILRTVGIPAERFQEDHLRVLRALRFAFEFSLTIESNTEAAVHKLVGLVKTVSRERIRDELFKILNGKRPLACLAAGSQWGLWKEIFGASDSRFKDFLDEEGFFKSLSQNNKWSIFFILLTSENFDEPILEKITLSRVEQRAVLAFKNLLGDLTEIKKKNLGELLIAAKEESFKLLLDWLALEKNGKDVWALNLRQALFDRNLNSDYPQALLNGDDVVKIGAKGASIGRLLQLAYARQLEHQKTDKTEMLTWLKTQI